MPTFKDRGFSAAEGVNTIISLNRINFFYFAGGSVVGNVVSHLPHERRLYCDSKANEFVLFVRRIGHLLIGTLLHLLHMSAGYTVMLVVMLYNAYIFITVVVAAGAGCV